MSGVLTQGDGQDWITSYKVSTFLENVETFVQNKQGQDVSSDFKCMSTTCQEGGGRQFESVMTN